MKELLKDLIRKKKFQNYLIRKKYLIAIDGTQKFFRNYRWEDECLKRHVGGEEKSHNTMYMYWMQSLYWITALYCLS